MCTLGIGFFPQTPVPLMIGSNRDENPKRPSDDWYLRWEKTIFSPLDVRKGTWIGVNTFGIFCAITNWDIINDDKLHGMTSRGTVVINTLKLQNIHEIYNYWNSLSAKDYKPFNIIAASNDFLILLSCDHKNINIKRLHAGFHILTGLGYNTNCKRELYLRNCVTTNRHSGLDPGAKIFSPQINKILIQELSAHNDGAGSEDSICVHDDEHKWETVSSAVISLHVPSVQRPKGWWDIQQINCKPCFVNHHKWIKHEIML